MEMHTRESLAAIHGLNVPRPRQKPHRKILNWLQKLHAAYCLQRDIHRLVDQMRSLDDRMLRDIGLERGCLYDWARSTCTERQISVKSPEQRR